MIIKKLKFNMEHVYRKGVPQNLKIKGGGQMGLRIISILGLRIIRGIIRVYGLRIISIKGLRIISI